MGSSGICNHLTASIPGTRDRFLVSAFGMRWCEVTASNLLVVDSNGKVISGVGQPEATAFYIHSVLIHALFFKCSPCIGVPHTSYIIPLTTVYFNQVCNPRMEKCNLDSTLCNEACLCVAALAFEAPERHGSLPHASVLGHCNLCAGGPFVADVPPEQPPLLPGAPCGSSMSWISKATCC